MFVMVNIWLIWVMMMEYNMENHMVNILLISWFMMMVIMWLMRVNNNLVGGFNLPL